MTASATVTISLAILCRLLAIMPSQLFANQDPAVIYIKKNYLKKFSVSEKKEEDLADCAGRSQT